MELCDMTKAIVPVEHVQNAIFLLHGQRVGLRGQPSK